MVKIFYCQEKKRSPRLVLRLHNLCWRHAIQCHSVLTPTRALTSKKLFGLYFHACISHSAFLLRLVSHKSTNAEMFERLFEELTDITRKTWNRKIEDLASNAFTFTFTILQYKYSLSKRLICSDSVRFVKVLSVSAHGPHS